MVAPCLSSESQRTLNIIGGMGGEMAQELRVLNALAAEDSGSVPAPLQSSVTPSPGMQHHLLTFTGTWYA